MRLLTAGLLLVAPLCAAFYLPGLAPVSFCEEGEESEGCKSLIELFVNRLDSVESVLPYEYDAFDFCQDTEEKRPSENLGQVLFGERIASSPYKSEFNKKNTFYLFNHVDITIMYHSGKDENWPGARLVMARLRPQR
ncbi:transmembrane 9 superfamily member 2-like [Limosa lapponica baueri]|uniref:Transmembrane 9 superfamily member n=1 Tax=Limosa lapponica baueri TaxID=1758121 RepID=A0A2I0TF37_LIMLA|nr:transmembrane 9 superfamily member 2-like [Limosa lapponica baueri]